MLKKLLATFSDKVDGQEALANKKAQLIYAALEAHPNDYRIVPDKSARSRMNICFRVTKVSKSAIRLPGIYFVYSYSCRAATSRRLRKLSLSSPPSRASPG